MSQNYLQMAYLRHVFLVFSSSSWLTMFSSRYRKHLDGAWPASGITHEDGQERYVYDAHGGGTRSKLTFIIYLKLESII